MTHHETPKLDPQADLDRRCRLASLLIRTAIIELAPTIPPGVSHQFFVPLERQLGSVDDAYYYSDNHLLQFMSQGLPGFISQCQVGLSLPPVYAIVTLQTAVTTGLSLYE